jgi:hypothetical protein
METPKDLITAMEARALLGVSRLKMRDLLREGALRHFPNPLDKRQKLVSRAEVLALIPKRAEAA